jgi:hypothetical protein
MQAKNPVTHLEYMATSSGQLPLVGTWLRLFAANNDAVDCKPWARAVERQGVFRERGTFAFEAVVNLNVKVFKRGP